MTKPADTEEEKDAVTCMLNGNNNQNQKVQMWFQKT